MRVFRRNEIGESLSYLVGGADGQNQKEIISPVFSRDFKESVHQVLKKNTGVAIIGESISCGDALERAERYSVGRLNPKFEKERFDALLLHLLTCARNPCPAKNKLFP